MCIIYHCQYVFLILGIWNMRQYEDLSTDIAERIQCYNISYKHNKESEILFITECHFVYYIILL